MEHLPVHYEAPWSCRGVYETPWTIHSLLYGAIRCACDVCPDLACTWFLCESLTVRPCLILGITRPLVDSTAPRLYGLRLANTSVRAPSPSSLLVPTLLAVQRDFRPLSTRLPLARLVGPSQLGKTAPNYASSRCWAVQVPAHQNFIGIPSLLLDYSSSQELY